MYYCQAVTIKGCVFKNNSNAATNLTSGQSIASVYIDATCNDILITDCMFSNIGQLNISGGSGYGIEANNIESLMVVKNTFRNAKAVMIAPCTGALTQSGYVEGNIWNPTQFFNTTNVTNNPQSNLGFTFNTVVNGFPSIINTDIIRKSFNLDNLSSPGNWNLPYDSPLLPKSIIAYKTSIGWVAEQRTGINRPSGALGIGYWVVPFLEIWVETASINIIVDQNVTVSAGDNFTIGEITNEYAMQDGYTINSNWNNEDALGVMYVAKGLVDIQKVLNLTSANQYVPSSSS